MNSFSRSSCSGIFLTLAIVYVSFLILVVSAEQEQLKPEKIYEDCGTKTKKCFGDEQGCIQNKNCTFVAALKETDTNFIVEIQNNCNLNKVDNLFFAVGSLAAHSGNGKGATVTCLPTFDDFKVMILWSGNEKCPERGAMEKKWSAIPKDKARLHICSKAEKIENLVDFATHNVLVQTGKGYVPSLTSKTTLENDAVYITQGPSDIVTEETMKKDDNNSSTGTGTTLLTAVNMIVFTLISTCLVR